MNATNLNSPQRDPADRALRYLEAALKRNPATQASEILEIRSRFYGQKRTANAGSSRVDMDELRESQMAEIDAIRRQFWASDINELRTKLSQLDSTPFPDLLLAVRRLRTVGEHRHQFPSLVEAGSDVPGLFKAFRGALVSPPLEAASLREQATYQIEDFAEVRTFVKTVRKVMPEVFALEADWLNMLLRMKPVRIASAPQTPFSLSSSEVDYGWIISILIFITIAILRAAMR